MLTREGLVKRGWGPTTFSLWPSWPHACYYKKSLLGPIPFNASYHAPLFLSILSYSLYICMHVYIYLSMSTWPSPHYSIYIHRQSMFVCVGCVSFPCEIYIHIAVCLCAPTCTLHYGQGYMSGYCILWYHLMITANSSFMFISQSIWYHISLISSSSHDFFFYWLCVCVRPFWSLN